MTIPLKENMLKELEIIAFPGTPLQIAKEEENSHIVSIFTEEYPSEKPLWTDKRFLFIQNEKPISRKKDLPSLSVVLRKMEELVGMPYLWGGNGPPMENLLLWYPPSIEISKVDSLVRQHWMLEGVDCSGLLYYATNGYTPRNTCDLISYGYGVAVEGKDRSLWKLQKGDLIVWKGHVIIVLDENRVIESLGGRGVIITPLSERINQIEKTLYRSPCDTWPCSDPSLEKRSYVIRRFHPDAL